MRRVRVLLAARDPGGAAQMRELVPALRADPRASVTVAASGAAFDILAAANHAPVRFALPGGATHVPSGGDPAPLLEAARALLARLVPDVLVVSISSLGVGLDEALLAGAAGRPTFALQDYPGDANAIDGAFAGLYFVRDEAAARLTRVRFGVATLPVGSLRHAAYAGIDVLALRGRTRAALGAGDRPVIGFFGQPPEIPGHEAAFRDLVAALARRPPAPLCVLREHPKALDLRDAHLAALAAGGVPARDATGPGAVELWLTACDLVTTCFSHCAMDYAFLNAVSPEPLGAALFLLTTPEARAFVRESTGLEAPDGVELGLGRVAATAADVVRLLDHLLTAEARQAYHAASRKLPRGADLARIVDTVLGAAA